MQQKKANVLAAENVTGLRSRCASCFFIIVVKLTLFLSPPHRIAVNLTRRKAASGGQHVPGPLDGHCPHTEDIRGGTGSVATVETEEQRATTLLAFLTSELFSIKFSFFSSQI